MYLIEYVRFPFINWTKENNKTVLIDIFCWIPSDFQLQIIRVLSRFRRCNKRKLLWVQRSFFFSLLSNKREREREEWQLWASEWRRCRRKQLQISVCVAIAIVYCILFENPTFDSIKFECMCVLKNEFFVFHSVE